MSSRQPVKAFTVYDLTFTGLETWSLSRRKNLATLEFLPSSLVFSALCKTFFFGWGGERILHMVGLYYSARIAFSLQLVQDQTLKYYLGNREVRLIGKEVVSVCVCEAPVPPLPLMWNLPCHTTSHIYSTYLRCYRDKFT